MIGIAQVRASLNITPTGASQLSFQSQPTSFQANVLGNNGPTPGQLQATIAGIAVSFAQLSQMGGLCVIQNFELSVANGGSGNYISVGIFDSATGHYFPMLEVQPQEVYVVRLSRLLGKDQTSGTGTVGSTGSMHVKAIPIAGSPASQVANFGVFAFDA